jgi:hypothetical protein
MAALGSVRIVLNPALLNPFLEDVTRTSARRAAQRTASRANDNVRAANRVRTGALAKSYEEKQSRTTQGRYASGFDVSSPLAYAPLQEDGAGPSVARKGHVLRFMPKGSNVFIFRPRTKGFPGAHQLRNAYRDLSLRDFLP